MYNFFSFIFCILLIHDKAGNMINHGHIPYAILFLHFAGISSHANLSDFIEIGVLLCFCALQNHGLKTLFSLSAILQHTPSLPFGFSNLKAGLDKSVLLSIYASSSNSRSVNSSRGTFLIHKENNRFKVKPQPPPYKHDMFIIKIYFSK